MVSFATYLHSQTCQTSLPIDQIKFVGYSVPHRIDVRQQLSVALAGYPTLPLREAPLDEFLRVHTPDYMQKLRRMAAGDPPEELPRLSYECTGYAYCLPGYRYGLGGMLEAVDRMKVGTLQRAYGYSLGGHHAYADWGHGYCLLNPQAAATRYAQDHGFGRVLIVDWDIHHGDGTQSIFAHDPSVHCISIHGGIDLYMAVQRVMPSGTTVAAEQVGHRNIPLLERTLRDQDPSEIGLPGRFYRAPEALQAFSTALAEIPWLPAMIMIFAGCDSHKDDCGAGVTDWTNGEFRALTRRVLDVAIRASCPVLSVQGGAYNTPVAISAATAHVEELATYV